MKECVANGGAAAQVACGSLLTKALIKKKKLILSKYSSFVQK